MTLHCYLGLTVHVSVVCVIVVRLHLPYCRGEGWLAVLVATQCVVLSACGAVAGCKDHQVPPFHTSHMP